MRFLLPFAGLSMAMLVLFAGAFGDLPSWRQDLPLLISRTEVTPPAGSLAAPRPLPPQPLPPQPLPRSETVQASEVDRTQRHVQDLRDEIAKETADLATLRATAEQTRQELAGLREQRQREQAALEQANARRQLTDDRYVSTQLAADHGIPPTAAPPDNPPVDRETAAAAMRASPVAPTNAKPATSGSQPTDPSSRSSANPRVETAAKRPAAVKNLEQARTALASGHGVQARRLLGLARTQMARRPAAPEAVDSASGAAPAAQVGNAISLLDRGDSVGALQAIDQALTMADGTLPELARRNYRARPDAAVR